MCGVVRLVVSMRAGEENGKGIVFYQKNKKIMIKKIFPKSSL